MTLNQTIGRTIGSGATGLRVRVLFGFGGIVVLAAVAAVAASQIDGGSNVPARSAPRAAFVAPVQTDVPLTYYIVSTQEQAQAVLRAEDEAAQVRFAAGESGVPYEVTVLIARDEASLEMAMRGFNHANEVRSGLGLPQMTLVDLRGP